MSDHFEEILKLLKKLGAEEITIEEFEKELVERKLDPNAKSANQDRVWRGDALPCKKDIYLFKECLYGPTPVMNVVAANGMIGAARILHKHGTNVNATDCIGATSLIEACRADRRNMVRLLVSELGADINAINNLKNTPLSIAVLFQNWTVVKILAQLSPGTMNLRSERSNHILKQSQYAQLLKSPKLLNVSRYECRDVCQVIFDASRCKGVKEHASLQAALALWNLEQTRHFLKRDQPQMFAGLAKTTEAERFNVFLCIKRRGVRHRLTDQNLWLILKDYI